MSSEFPKISVLIPTFNRANYLTKCLDNILLQTLPAAQIIVVNDGSTDNTRQVLETYMNKIDYLEGDDLCSRSNAINYGLNYVTGEYLWIFDDDDRLSASSPFIHALQKEITDIMNSILLQGINEAR
jgi:glycosyltransferase involved in cell wall biosynthesis